MQPPRSVFAHRSVTMPRDLCGTIEQSIRLSIGASALNPSYSLNTSKAAVPSVDNVRLTSRISLMLS
jgi:hypothetical protein